MVQAPNVDTRGCRCRSPCACCCAQFHRECGGVPEPVVRVLRCIVPTLSPNSLTAFVEFTRCRPGSLAELPVVDEGRLSRKSLMVRCAGK